MTNEQVSAMKKLIPVIKTIAALDPDGFNRVILALAVSITALVAALVILAHFSTGMVAAAAGMLIGAAAILVLAKAIGVIVESKELINPPKLSTIRIGTLIIFAKTEPELYMYAKELDFDKKDFEPQKYNVQVCIKLNRCDNDGFVYTIIK